MIKNSFVAIGNSPSSGSTLLGDLLDSTTIGICGPELNLLTNKHLYKNYSQFQNNPVGFSQSSAIYSAVNSVNQNRLYAYGMNVSELQSLASQTGNAREFLDGFGYRYAVFRGNPEATWFEKTPQNIGIARKFLETFPDKFFIHIVRNPVYIAESLLRRGFSPGIAVFAWLIEVANLYNFTSDRLLLVRYEELVSNPWNIVSDLVNTICKKNIDPNTIKENYESNEYRSAVSKKIKSWGVNQYGKIINANNRTPSPKTLGLFRSALDWKISTVWANTYQLPEISYREAVEYYGYMEEVEKLIRDSHPAGVLSTGISFRTHILKKNVKELIFCHKFPKCIHSPVEEV